MMEIRTNNIINTNTQLRSPVKIDTVKEETLPGESMTLSGGGNDPQLITRDMMPSESPKETGESRETPQKSPGPGENIPFEDHIKGAVDFILDKTIQQYPGFGNHQAGMFKKSHQIHSHLKDMTGFLQKENIGHVGSMSPEQSDSLRGRASEFIADTIADQYGMMPNMKRNPIFMSPIESNVKGYFEYLAKENITLSVDENSKILVTKHPQP